MSGKRVLAWSLPLALASADVLALGLGGLQTQSALNQPFFGTLELLDVAPADLDVVKVAIAPAREFERAGIERYQYLNQLRFTPQATPDGRVFIEVSSREPIREPYLDFLVEAIWPEGRLVKGYTVLLDPPVSTRGAPARLQSPVAGSGRAPVAADAVPASRPALPPPPPNAIGAEAFPLRIGPVPRGVGLWQLVRRNRLSGATDAQTALALYRNNQAAFIRGNINRLSAGRMLTIPNRAELFALDPATAEREFAAAMRGREVRRTPLAAPEAMADAGGDSHLKLAGLPPRTAPDAAATVSPPAPAPDAAGPGPIGEEDVPPAIRQDLDLALETSESAQQEAVELRDRVRELETQLTDIQRLLQLRNAELAQLQQVPEGEGAAVPGVLSAPEPVATPAVPVEEAQAPPETSAATTPAEPAAQPPAPIASPPTPVEPPSPPPPADVAPPAPVAIPPAPAPVSAFDWRDWWLPLAGLAGAAGLGLLGILALRRRRAASAGEPPDLSPDPRDNDDEEPAAPAREEAVPAPTVSETLATAASGTPALLQKSRTPPPPALDQEPAPAAPPSPVSAPDQDDILSEADIYIAYGRHDEAIQLLSTEQARAPARWEIGFKLAEAYWAAGRRSELDDLLARLRAERQDQAHPDDWASLKALIEADATGADGFPDLDASTGVAPTDDQSAAPPDAVSLDMRDPWTPPEPTPPEPLPDERLVAPPMPEDAGAGDPFADLDLALPATSGTDLDAAATGPGADDRSLPDLSVPDALASPDSEPPPVPALELPPLELPPLESPVAAPTAPTGAEADLPPLTVPGAMSSSRRADSTSLLSSQWQGDSAIWDDNATKLDLARAYLDMDDGDSAREILQEVAAEGRDEQREEARELLRQLDGKTA